MRLLVLYVWLIAALGRLDTLTASEPRDVFHVTLGNHQVILPAGYRGLNCFPDEPIAIIRQQPLTFLMTAGDSTYWMTGKSLGTAVPVEKVLAPGAKGSFDNGYAGAGAVYLDEKRGELLVFYHAEDWENMRPVQYNKELHGAYWSIGLAVAKIDGTQREKVGQVLAASVKKADATQEMQGIGDVCVIPNASQTYLYAYYSDMSRKQGPFAANAKIGMARCKIEDGGRPGKWLKYCDGDFTEPGLGGQEGAVVFPPFLNSDVFAPHVTYVHTLNVYLMVCNVMYYPDHLKPRAKESGLYYCYSKDGIRWSTPTKLVGGPSVPYQGIEYIAHPRLLLNRETNSTVSGMLLYCYSPHWGSPPPKLPHHLAGRPITLTRSHSTDPLPEPSKSSWEVLMAIIPRLRSSESNDKGEVIAGDLTGVPLSHDDVRAISTVASLQRAILAQTGIDDEDIGRLAALPRLQWLDVSQTNITDEAVSSLTHLHTLKQLDVSGTKLSSGAIKRLKNALPRCEVQF